MSKHRDYGQTTSALLNNQKHKFERKISDLEDRLFVLNAETAMLRRVAAFAAERGLLDQWQNEE